MRSPPFLRGFWPFWGLISSLIRGIGVLSRCVRHHWCLLPIQPAYEEPDDYRRQDNEEQCSYYHPEHHGEHSEAAHHIYVLLLSAGNNLHQVALDSDEGSILVIVSFRIRKTHYILVPLLLARVSSYSTTINSNNNTRNLRAVGLWFIPVILIPLIWPAYAISINQFDLWLHGIYFQTHRGAQTLFESINYDFQTDPLFLSLGIVGLVFAAIRRDAVLLLWTIPFLIFLYFAGFVSYWHGIYEAPLPPSEPIQKATAESLLRKLIELNDPHYMPAGYILAVMLERKRLLKVKEQHVRDGQRIFIYEQPSTGDIFTIPDPNLQLNQLEQVQQDVATLLEQGLNPAPIPAPAAESAPASPAEPMAQ